MLKFSNIRTLLLIVLFASSYASMSVSTGCGGGGGGKDTELNGVVQEVIGGSVSDIEVKILQGGDEKDSDRTNDLGEFELDFNISSNLATLQFQGPNYTLSRAINVSKDSEIDMSLILEITPPNITITNWTVLQDAIDLDGFDQFIFDETEAAFRIDGDGDNCIKAVDEARVEITTGSVTLLDCKNGLETESFALIMVEADGDINIIAEKEGIKSQDNSVVNVGMSTTAVDNNIFITSTEENGIRASGSSEVVITPQNACTITGAKDAVNQSGTSFVNTGTCTLFSP